MWSLLPCLGSPLESFLIYTIIFVCLSSGLGTLTSLPASPPLRPLEARSLSHHPPARCLARLSIANRIPFRSLVSAPMLQDLGLSNVCWRPKTGMLSSSWPRSRPAMAAMLHFCYVLEAFPVCFTTSKSMCIFSKCQNTGKQGKQGNGGTV